MSFSPRRIMADVLLMPALQLSNPIRLLISVETSDFARLTLRWLMRIHDTYFLVSNIGPFKSKTGGMAFKPSPIFSATQTATPPTQAFGQDLRPTANSGVPLRERFAGRALP
jgi:hypothetical protein